MKKLRKLVTHPLDGGKTYAYCQGYEVGDTVEVYLNNYSGPLVKGVVIDVGKPFVVSAMDLWIEHRVLVQLIDDGRKQVFNSGDVGLRVEAQE